VDLMLWRPVWRQRGRTDAALALPAKRATVAVALKAIVDALRSPHARSARGTRVIGAGTGSAA
jgi:hypothetical protein